MTDAGSTSRVATPDRQVWADVCAVGGEISLRAESDWAGRAHPVEVFTGPFMHAGHAFSVTGRGAPVAEVLCNGPSPILVPLGRLLWRERGVIITPHRQRARTGDGAATVLELSESGRFACAASSLGRVFMLFLPMGGVIEVVADRWLCAAGLHREPLAPGAAMRLDRFSAVEGDGLLLLHGAGSAYEVMLESDETLRIAHRALLYKEQGLRVVQLPGAGAAPLCCCGPGLLAVQTGGGRG
jgi:hypothetical protein